MASNVALSMDAASSERASISTRFGAGSGTSVDTTNVYAEVDLEAKAKALAACSPKTPGTHQSPWKATAGMMEFLKTL